MRYLIDTNIFVFFVADPDRLSRDIRMLLEDYDSQLYISTESVKELVVGFNNKGLFSKRWKTAEEMVNAIENEYYITILPVRKEHIMTYARMTLNDAQGHKDPSDHVIIAHAITEGLPLISSDTFPVLSKSGPRTHR